MEGSGEENRPPISPLLAVRPIFAPSFDMRRDYLNRRRSELEALLNSGRGNEWKYVIPLAHNIRGTAGLFGFDSICEAAENLASAIQNADPLCMHYLEIYAKAVEEAYV